MKKFLLSIVIFILTILPSKADEGMWLLMLIQRLNYTDMQKEGLQLTPEEIYNVNNSSLKDAIVNFGGFCTGEIISDQGLVLTNHHCGYSAIADLSTPEKDYLKNGFLANKHSEELPVKGLYVRVLVRMGDATKRIKDIIKANLSPQQKEKIIKEEIEKIKKENTQNGKYIVEVKPFFEGNEYYYFIYQQFNDIRLVAAPSSSIGKFGGDTDNWEWPRHTADFSMFRIYADKEGNPASYSENNIPYKPKYSLPISIKSIKEGDFAMMLGYPGSTNRYLTSYGIDYLINNSYPSMIEVAYKYMQVIKEHMSQGKSIEINYAKNYARLANQWKNRKGLIEAVIKNKVIEDKQKQEVLFNTWANKKNNKQQYGTVLGNLKNYYHIKSEDTKGDTYIDMFFRFSLYSNIPNLEASLKNYITTDLQAKNQQKLELLKKIDQYYDKKDPKLEQELFEATFNLYEEKVKTGSILYIIKQSKQKQSYSQIVNNSIFQSKQKLISFLDNLTLDRLEEDPLYKFLGQLNQSLQKNIIQKQPIEQKFKDTQELFIEGLRQIQPNKKFYPDANFTMRLTYGSVQRLQERADRPNDAKDNYYTTLKGMVAKYKEGDEEFNLPQKLIDLYNMKDYGNYINEYGELPLNFLSNNDITGGNSGSPVINAKGELIGVAFDGNSEALSGDLLFNNNLQRCINLDIRFVLFMLGKYWGAENLLSEIKIVK